MLTHMLAHSIPDLLPAKNGEEPTIQFLLEVVEILTNYVRKTFDRSTKVLDFHHPHQLLEGMEGFNLELSDQPESLEQILVDCRDTLKYGVRTGTAGWTIYHTVQSSHHHTIITSINDDDDFKWWFIYDRLYLFIHISYVLIIWNGQF